MVLFHQQSFGFQQPLLDDILVKTDLHILLEHVGKIVFVNEKRLCHRVQRKIAAEVQIDIMQGVAQDACFCALAKTCSRLYKERLMPIRMRRMSAMPSLW